MMLLPGIQNFALKSDGSLWGWGRNKNGELGDGTMETRLYPIKIMYDIKFINYGTYFIKDSNIIHKGPYAIKNDNTLWIWGPEENMGNSTKFQKEDILPRKIMDNVIYAAGLPGGQSVVIKEDGNLWTWGNNSFGQLGDGTKIDRDKPMQVLNDVVYVAGNEFCTVALKNDGSLWLMGMYNDIGHDNLIYKPHKIMDGIMLPK